MVRGRARQRLKYQGKEIKSSNLLKGGDGQRFTRADRELIAQCYFESGSYSAVAKKLGISPGSVEKSIKEAETDLMLAQIRARVLEKMAGKAAGLAQEIMGSVDPGELKTENFVVRDKDGLPLRGVTVGPSLKDKAIAAGIMMEKSQGLAESGSKMRGIEGTGGGLLLPEDLETARLALESQLKSLKITHFKFGENGGITDVRQAEFEGSSGSGPSETEDLSIEADFEEIGPFDIPAGES